MNNSQLQLDYAPPPRPWRRRKVRLAVLLLLVVGVGVFAGFHWADYSSRVRLLYWQHRCLNDQPPADCVVWDEDPARTPGLLAQKNQYVSLAPRNIRRLTIAARVPHEYSAFQSLVSATPPPLPQAVLFMHERKSPRGKRRLVIVTSSFQEAEPLFIDGFDIDSQSFDIGTWKLKPVDHSGPREIDVMSSNTPPLQNMRIFAGQIDPADESHFTIRYQVGDKDTIVDGYLRDSNPPGDWDDIQFTKRQ